MQETIIILMGAVLLDWTLGDPPNAFHPVAWMGSLINFLRRGAIGRGSRYQFIYGLFLIFSCCCLIFILSAWFLSYVWSVNPYLYLAASILLFKSSFTFQGLKKAAVKVRSSMEGGNLEQARDIVATHLVSRETSGLEAPAVASAAVESVAENFTDGLVAPMLYFLLGGVPGALAYRFVNTTDAMLGYRDPAHEYLGKGTAWLDDILNYVPARLAGLLLVAAARLRGENGKGAWVTMWSHHSLTQSPNAGWTMSAAAGALDISLEKKGHYKLGHGGPPSAEHISRATDLVKTAYILSIIVIIIIILGVRHGRGA